MPSISKHSKKNFKKLIFGEQSAQEFCMEAWLGKHKDLMEEIKSNIRRLAGQGLARVGELKISSHLVDRGCDWNEVYFRTEEKMADETNATRLCEVLQTLDFGVEKVKFQKGCDGDSDECEHFDKNRDYCHLNCCNSASEIREGDICHGYTCECPAYIIYGLDWSSIDDSEDQEEVQAGNTCVICHEDLRTASGEVLCTLVPCGHVFHQTCIDTHTANNDTCPICRQNIERKQKLFFS